MGIVSGWPCAVIVLIITGPSAPPPPSSLAALVVALPELPTRVLGLGEKCLSGFHEHAILEYFGGARTPLVHFKDNLEICRVRVRCRVFEVLAEAL